MKKVRDLSLTIKISMYLSALALLIIGLIILLFSLSSNKKRYNDYLFMLNENKSVIEKVPALSDNVVEGNKNAVRQLKKLSKQHNERLHILEKGGTYNIINVSTTIYPFPEKYDDYFDSIIILNTNIILGIQTLNKEPSITDAGKKDMVSKISGELKKNAEAVSNLTKLLIIQMNDNFKKTFALHSLFIVIIISGIGVLIILLFLFIRKNIIVPLEKANHSLDLIYHGVIFSNEIFLTKSDDEMGEVNVKINKIIGRLRKTVKFITEIGNGSFDTDYQIFGEKITP
jgi:methyl-accepting chemotaxis protein